ncbi:MAG: endolytic transglycosylase MltG [Anaerolineales bacterium]|nr:endolytic transglycosylase MltG [Anaerolineales bacterium]
MKKRKSPNAVFFLTSLALALCLAIVLGGVISLGLPMQAAREFGPPTTSLTTSQRVRLSAYLLWRAEELTSPINPNGIAIPFQIGLGEPLPTIAARLKDDSIIKDPDLFISYLQYTGLDTTIQAGDYELSAAMTPVEVAHHFQDATPKEVTFTILEGWRLEEIVETLPTTGLAITPQTFLEAASTVSSSHAFLQKIPPQGTLEGFLMPDSYEVPRDLTISQLLIHILDNFGIQMTFDIREGFERQGLSPYEAVTLASIIEREAVNEEEMPLIASVFLNRLVVGMKLEADSTVQYALGFNHEQNTWWTNPLTLKHLETESTYNTYRYPGLPPGPIANPGLTAMRAVAFPAQSPYYYFRAACDNSGRHIFAETFEEHLLNACPEDE